MRIHFKRSGGFSGIRLAADIDTDSLPPEEARSIEALVDKSDLFHIPKEGRIPGKTRDGFEYLLKLEVKGKRHTVRLAEEAVPASVQPLIDRLLPFTRNQTPP